MWAVNLTTLLLNLETQGPHSFTDSRMSVWVGSFPGHGGVITTIPPSPRVWVHAETGRKAHSEGVAVQLPVGLSTRWTWDNKHIYVTGEVQSTESGIALFVLKLCQLPDNLDLTFQSTYAPQGACTQLLQHLAVTGTVTSNTKLNAWQIFSLNRSSKLWEVLQALHPAITAVPHSETLPQSPQQLFDTGVSVSTHQQSGPPNLPGSSLNVDAPTVPKRPRTKVSGVPTAQHSEDMQAAQAQLLEAQTRLSALEDDLQSYKVKVSDLQNINSSLTKVKTLCKPCKETGRAELKTQLAYLHLHTPSCMQSS